MRSYKKLYNSYNCHSYKKIGQSCNGDHNIGLVSLSVQKMDGAYKKLVYQMRRVIFGLLGLSPQNCNLGLKTAICIAILKGFQKRIILLLLKLFPNEIAVCVFAFSVREESFWGRIGLHSLSRTLFR